jgi:hypothetical protein
VAAYAIAQNTLKLDAQTGIVVESKVYLEEDENTDQAMPSGSITAEEVEKIKLTDGLVGQTPLMVDGQFVEKKSIVFPSYREDFSKNNAA